MSTLQEPIKITEANNIEVDEDKSYGSRNADKFVVRLPKGMRQTIAEVARNYHRSMNSEIVSRLESSLKVEFCLNGKGDNADSVASETVNTELNMQEFSIVEQVRKLSDERKEALLTIIAGLSA